MSNIVTSIIQSKHLLELGLDPKTADCHWWYAEGEEHLHLGRAYDINELPAWSLSALLEVMPKEMLPALEWREGNEEWEANVWVNHNIHCISHYDKLCAVYSMVCWLLEQGFIKKGGEE